MSDGVRQVLRAQQAFEHLSNAVRQGVFRLKIPLCRYRQAIIHIHYIVKIPLDDIRDRLPEIVRGDDVVQLIASLCRIVIAQIQISVMREDEEGANQIRVVSLIGVAALFVKDERSAGIALCQLFLFGVGDHFADVKFKLVQIKGMGVFKFFLHNIHA